MDAARSYGLDNMGWRPICHIARNSFTNTAQHIDIVQQYTCFDRAQQ